LSGIACQQCTLLDYRASGESSTTNYFVAGANIRATDVNIAMKKSTRMN